MSPTTQMPPDRSHVRTEARHPKSMELDALNARQFVNLMIEDHRVVCQAVLDASDALASLIDAIASRMSRGGRLIYIGAGTSGRLGVLDASECPPTFQSEPGQVIGIIAGGDAALRKSSEGKEDDFNGAADALAQVKLVPDDTVIGIAAGGTTPYVLGAVRIAKSAGSATALLTCAAPRLLVADCDQIIVLDTGPEILTGSTRLKAGSATKLALNIITTGVFVRMGKTFSNLMVDLRASNDKLADRAIRILCELDPTLDREAAFRLLQAAGSQVKLAIIMRKLAVPREQAEDLLSRSNGSIRAALAKR